MFSFGHTMLKSLRVGEEVSRLCFYIRSFLQSPCWAGPRLEHLAVSRQSCLPGPQCHRSSASVLFLTGAPRVPRASPPKQSSPDSGLEEGTPKHPVTQDRRLRVHRGSFVRVWPGW